MGSRFAFIFWITHSGASTLGQFSAQHGITGSAWTVALIGMAICEVVSRSALMAIRRERLQVRPRRPVRLTPLPSPVVILNHLTGRTALTVRLVGLGLISWTV